MERHFEELDVKMEGLVTGLNSGLGRRSKDHHFFFLNKRPVDLPSFGKVSMLLLVLVLVRSFKKNKGYHRVLSSCFGEPRKVPDHHFGFQRSFGASRSQCDAREAHGVPRH